MKKSPCNHEEADTRIFLHVADAVSKGFNTLMIKANDTDILMIFVAMYARLQEKGLQELWVTYGQGCHVKWIPVHELTVALSPERIG